MSQERMHFELLAEEHPQDQDKRSWLMHAGYLRREAHQHKDLTTLRSKFLEQRAWDKARGSARALDCPIHELDKAALCAPVDVSVLPAYSAVVSLCFKLRSPLLTRDDDPFYLFDNPVRKDHVFGVPFLAAATVKGLAADAFQRGFPPELGWESLGKKDQERKTTYRRKFDQARRLFGLASDGEAFDSEAGRLHFSPVWFSHVQYLVMNPTKRDASGIGTQPIHFEAVSPVNDKGKPVEGEVRFFYFNPAGAEQSDEATVRTDIACLIGALAAWWPVLGLGAKRLAGYGAIVPTAADFRGCAFATIRETWQGKGETSWRKLAQHLAGVQA